MARSFHIAFSSVVKLRKDLSSLNVAFVPLTLFLLLFIGGSLTLPVAIFIGHKASATPAYQPSDAKAVLGAAAIASPLKLAGTIVFNVPAELEQDVTVNGTATFNGPVLIKGKQLDLGDGTITASNVVYAVKAGDGLSIVGGQTPTLTNTGVLSFQGATGAVTLTAGSGIAIDGTKISSTVSNPNAFGTVSDGTNSVSAGSSNDTLTFSGGTGISIALDSSNKKLTITNTGSGGSGVDFSGGVTGTLGTANGGTGISSYTVGDTLYASGTTTLSKLGIGGSGTVLVSNGTAPTWSASLTGLTGLTSSGTIDFSALTSNGVLHTTGGNGTLGVAAVALGSEVSGTLPVTNGGLGTNLSSSAATGDLLYADSTTTFARLADIASGSCLISGGIGIAPSWGSCTGGTTNYWQFTSGALSPIYNTADFLVGGSASSSAKFAFLNVNSGTPTASIGGTLVLAGDGSIQTTNNKTLTLGGSTTGNITLSPNNGSGTVSISGLSSGVVQSTNGVLGVSTVNLGTEVTSTLPVANGGTGTNTLTTNGVLYGNGTSAIQTTASGSANQVLAVNVQGVPTWTTISAGGTGCTNCLSSDPSSTQTIQPTGNVTGLSIYQTTTSTPSADIFDVSNSDGSVKYLQVDSNGNVVLNGNDLQIGGTTHLRTDDTNLANANDTFTYNTSSDMDGGAWTDNGNAQASSWYNETVTNTGANCILGIDTRCGTRPFPKKAIIIATNTHLYIYDASDDTLWMAFNEGTGFAISNSPTLNAVFALNGIVYLATSNSGLLAFDFINDRVVRYDYNAGSGGRAVFLGTIANRNSNKGFGARSSWGQIASDTVNGVFVRMINGKTYIATSTLGGVSVINVTDQKVNRYIDN